MQGAVVDSVCSIAASRVPPLRASWPAVQYCQLTLLEVCATLIMYENCVASLEERYITHKVFMEEVRRNDIIFPRNYSNSFEYWNEVLYQRCAKLVIGEKCKGILRRCSWKPKTPA